MSVIAKTIAVPVWEFQCELCQEVRVMKIENQLPGGWLAFESVRNNVGHTIHICGVCMVGVRKKIECARDTEVAREPH